MGAMDHPNRPQAEPGEGRCRPLVAAARPHRTVLFAEGHCLGTALLRGPVGVDGARAGRLPASALRRCSPRWWDDGWRDVGPAQGQVLVPGGCVLGVRLAPGAEPRALLDLLPGDLQRLSVRHRADGVLPLLGDLAGLTALDLWGTEVGDEVMFWVAGWGGLESLDLWGTRVGPAGLGRLSCLAKLRRLSAPGPSWGDSAIAALGRFPGLHVLELAGTTVGDRGIERLSGVPQLTRLSLWGTRITDRALPLLGKFPRLAALDLGDTSVTDAGIDALAALPRLRWVSLEGTLVTRTGLADLRAARRDCAVEPDLGRAGFHGVRSRAARPGARGV